MLETNYQELISTRHATTIIMIPGHVVPALLFDYHTFQHIKKARKETLKKVLLSY
jgi:hypothetical protein